MKLSSGRVVSSVAILLAWAGSAAAHDLFLRLDSFFVEPESDIEIALLNGSFDVSENPISRDRMQDVRVVGPTEADVAQPRDTDWTDRDSTSFLHFRTGAAGTYVVGVSTRPSLITLDGEAFDDYLRHDGVRDVLEARQAAGTEGTPARERYSKHVKALVQVGPTPGTAYAAVLGYPAELVPVENPYTLSSGDSMGVRLLSSGKPVPHHLLYVASADPRDHGQRLPSPTVLRTDEQGVARFLLDRPGRWYVRTIRMVEASGAVDYESDWATLTFGVTGDRGTEVRTVGEFDPDRFDAYVRSAVSLWEAPGLAVAVVKDDRLLFARGYGVERLGERTPVDEHTRFAIGSTTKAFTAAAIGLLVDEEKLSWDDPVRTRLPGFELSDPFLTREVTIRDLLTHRAGLGNADYLWYEQETSPREILDRVRYLEPSYSLRSSYIYQNIMYLAAGQVVEHVSGQPWAEFVRRRFLEPLGMDGTVALASELEGEARVATPHDRVGGEVIPIENASVDPVAPAGSIWSSVSDMSRWLRFLLAGGVTPDGRRLLSEETVEELFTPQTLLRREQFYPTAALTNPDWLSYGLGWFQQDYQGRKVDFHTGSIDGMVAIAGLMRDEGLGVYVLANRDHVELRHALMWRAFDLLLGGPVRDWSAELKLLYDARDAAAAEARAARMADREEGTRPTFAEPDYVGTYRDRLFGTVEISATGAGLRFEYGPGLAGPLEHWQNDEFMVRFDAAWRGERRIRFEIEDGRVTGLEMNGARFERVSDG